MKTVSAQDFLNKYGSNATLSLSGLVAPQEAPQPGFNERIASDFNQRGTKLADTLSKPAYTPSQAVALGTEATATAFGGISDVIGEAIKSIPGGKAALDAIGGATSSAFKALTDKLSNTKFFQEAAAGLPENSTLQNSLEAASSGGEIAGDILAAEGVKGTVQKTVDATKVAATKVGDAVNDAATKIRPATEALIGRSTELVKPSPTPAKAMGEVLQAKKPITPKDVEAFRHIETEGVKTYGDLEKRVTEFISNLSQKVDEHLGQDPTPHILSDLVTKSTSGSSRVVERNFVQTALDNLKELYQKSADDAAFADVEDLIQKAETTGLSNLEINDISRLYNSEFGSKAFSKMGDPLTSVNAQAYENIRSGLKDVARKGMGGSEAAAADKIVSSLYNTRKLITQNVAAVQKLQQRIAERGLLEKIGHAASKYGDLLTGGTLRGIIGGLLPRGAGYKILNALDLEERLSKNLEINRKALESGLDEAVISAAKKLQPSAPAPAPKK